jgi:hypothetical protein
VTGVGMTITVAPLTTTVMSALERHYAGVASGINNAVSRVAGLLAIAVFGVVLTRTFDARVATSLDALRLTATVRSAVDRELPKMAGADIDAATAGAPSKRAAVHDAVSGAFVSAFRLVLIGAAVLALVAAMAGAALR